MLFFFEIINNFVHLPYCYQKNTYMKSIVLFILCCFCIFSNTLAQGLDFKNWMDLIKDSAPIVHLGIPATHDSGAMLGGSTLKTQDCSIKEQLTNGVRGFDIRLAAQSEGKLGVYHDIQYQQLTWEDDVLPAFIYFLAHHPSETIWVSVKKERGDRNAFCKLLSESLLNPSFEPYILKNISSHLTLGDCRGKIIFCHRDTYLSQFPGVQCYDWPDNTSGNMTFKTQNGIVIKGYVEDEYGYDGAQKAEYKAQLTWNSLVDAMNRNDADARWMITFASATALPKAGPEDFAKVVNPFLVAKTSSLKRPCGILLIDFSGTTAGKTIIKNLITSNLNYYSKKLGK